MQSITTKYHGPTNTLGSRISATSASGIRIYMHYDYALDTIDNHKEAFKVLLSRLDWNTSEYAIGSTKEGYVFVPVVDTIRG